MVTMDNEHTTVMEYVYRHPYRSIADIADALDMALGRADEIIEDLHRECRVLIIREHFVPLYGRYVSYDSPLVEPERRAHESTARKTEKSMHR